MKICKTCGLQKDESLFYRRKNNFRASCKSCENEKKKDYKNSLRYKEIQKNNSEKYKKNGKLKEWSNKTYNKRKEKILQNKKNYYNEHKDKIKIKSKEYRYNNKDKILIFKKKYYNNIEKKDINKIIKKRLRTRIYLAMIGKIKSKKTMELVGCTVDFLTHYIESKFDERMTWNNYGDWHIDHIIPCSFFDLKCPLQQMVCFHYTNLQPLWAKDNLKKGNKILK